jgi:hypothetical protein
MSSVYLARETISERAASATSRSANSTAEAQLTEPRYIPVAIAMMYPPSHHLSYENQQVTATNGIQTWSFVVATFYYGASMTAITSGPVGRRLRKKAMAMSQSIMLF